MQIMSIDNLPDLDIRVARHDAFWQSEIIDRPVVTIQIANPNPIAVSPPAKTWPDLKSRWLDFEYRAEKARADILNTLYLGDAIPYVMPNLGPELFSAYFGMELEYGEDTAWGIPCLTDWEKADELQFSEDNYYFRQTIALTDALLTAGEGVFYTGLTDLHPGADAITAFRDPMNMNFDMIEHVEDVKRLLERITAEYFHIFDYFYDKLCRAGQLCATWMGIVSSRKYYIPSNDFSCMISKEMFDDIFLPGIREECRQLEASIYHLDGPDALRHLDSILEIPELNALQWVFGAGQGSASDWIEIYRRIQNAGKGNWIPARSDELDILIENLRPEGIYLAMQGVSSQEEAESVIRKVSRWKA